MAATQCWTVIDAGAEGLVNWQHVLPDYVAGWRIYRGVVGPGPHVFCPVAVFHGFHQYFVSVGLQFQLASWCARDCNWLRLYVAVL